MFEEVPQGTILRYAGRTYFFPMHESSRAYMKTERLRSDLWYQQECNPSVPQLVLAWTVDRLPAYVFIAAMPLAVLFTAMLVYHWSDLTWTQAVARAAPAIALSALAAWCGRQAYYTFLEWNAARCLRKYERKRDIASAVQYVRRHPDTKPL